MIAKLSWAFQDYHEVGKICNKFASLGRFNDATKWFT